MDYISALYYSSMRLYRDRLDVVTKGRWHWCPPGALPLPFPHAFGSFTGDPNSYHYEGGVGEIPGKNGRVRAPENPRYLGQNYCGTPETFLVGSLYSQRGTPEVDGEGVPICCISGPPIPGGGECGGEAGWISSTSGAGVEVGGGVVEPSSSTGGGVEVGGGLVEIAGSTGGGVEVGGAVDEHYVGGGVEVGGAVDDPNPDEFTGAGVTVGGGAVEPSSSAGGGVEVGGAVDEHYVGGGVEVGGGVVEGPVYMGCPDCPAGTWPHWMVSISGGTGDFAIFNGMILSGGPAGCLWPVQDPPNNIDGQFAFFVGFAVLGIFQTVAPFAALDFVAATDCIGPITLALQSSTGFGVPPATATVTGQ